MQSNIISKVVVFRGSSGYLVGVNDRITISYSIILSIYPLARVADYKKKVGLFVK